MKHPLIARVHAQPAGAEPERTRCDQDVLHGCAAILQQVRELLVVRRPLFTAHHDAHGSVGEHLAVRQSLRELPENGLVLHGHEVPWIARDRGRGRHRRFEDVVDECVGYVGFPVRANTPPREDEVQHRIHDFRLPYGVA